MMPIRVHNASHSSILWVVRMTEHFSRLVTMSEMISHMNRRATGSMPVLGSSRKTMEGSPIIAIATDSLRLLPPEVL